METITYLRINYGDLVDIIGSIMMLVAIFFFLLVIVGMRVPKKLRK